MTTKNNDDGIGHCWLNKTKVVSEEQERSKDSFIRDGWRRQHDPPRAEAAWSPSYCCALTLLVDASKMAKNAPGFFVAILQARKKRVITPSQLDPRFRWGGGVLSLCMAVVV